MSLEAWRQKWETAVEKNRGKDAIQALVEIEKLDPQDPLWAHRLGDACRRWGRPKDAEEAFVRAAEKYSAKGFLPRAIAMAKLVESLNPERKGLIEHFAPPPEMPRPVFSLEPAPLAPAKDAEADELRFDDAPESSIVTLLGSVDVAVDDVSAMTRLMNMASAIPEPTEPSMDRLATMAGFQLFAGLSRDALLGLSAETNLVEFDEGQVVFAKDAPATDLYAIVGGTALVSIAGVGDPVVLDEGEIFGEGCVLGEGRRTANVQAGRPLMTLAISKGSLEAVTRQHPEVGEVLYQLLVRRLLTNIMSTSPLFASFDHAVRLELTNLFEVRRAKAGTKIAEQGRKSDGLYLLLAGDLEGTRGPIARGTVFGHGSLLGGGTPSKQTVTARSEAILLRLAAAKFSSLAAVYPPLLAHLAGETDTLLA